MSQIIPLYNDKAFKTNFSMQYFFFILSSEYIVLYTAIHVLWQKIIPLCLNPFNTGFAKFVNESSFYNRQGWSAEAIICSLIFLQEIWAAALIKGVNNIHIQSDQIFDVGKHQV